MRLRICIEVLLTISLAVAPLANAQPLLLSTEEFTKQLQDQHYVLIDMSDEIQYQRFHLPNAVSLPYEVLTDYRNNVSTPISQDKLRLLLGRLGITADSPLVIYDDMGGLNAARLVWELEQLGHTRLKILDGGLVKWILEGRPVTNTPYAPETVTTYTANKSGRPLAADLSEVITASRTKSAVLLDVRSEAEYLGDVSDPRSGHIPGAKWWEWDQAVDFQQGFVQRNTAELRASLAKIGLTDTKQAVITYCHSSHRATQTFFTLQRLGFRNVKIYTGSILEYEQHKELPLRQGVAP